MKHDGKNACQLRRVTAQDLAELVQFYNREGKELLGEKKMGPITPHGGRGKRIVNPGTTSWLIVRDMASSGSEIVAAGTIGYHEDYETIGQIGMMLVALNYRGRGLAGKVLDGLIADARASGCRYIKLTSKPARTAARALYESRGFTLEEGSDRHYTLRLAGHVGPFEGRG